jgi:hypothetical protein
LENALSVVFSKSDYERLQQRPQAQFLQQLAAHNFTLLFVGCGASGLADENVGKLLRWFQEHWAGLAVRHFALVRERDQGAPWPEAVTPLVYGSEHEELPTS